MHIPAVAGACWRAITVALFHGFAMPAWAQGPEMSAEDLIGILQPRFERSLQFYEEAVRSVNTGAFDLARQQYQQSLAQLADLPMGASIGARSVIGIAELLIIDGDSERAREVLIQLRLTLKLPEEIEHQMRQANGEQMAQQFLCEASAMLLPAQIALGAPATAVHEAQSAMASYSDQPACRKSIQYWLGIALRASGRAAEAYRLTVDKAYQRSQDVSSLELLDRAHERAIIAGDYEAAGQYSAAILQLAVNLAKSTELDSAMQSSMFALAGNRAALTALRLGETVGAERLARRSQELSLSDGRSEADSLRRIPSWQPTSLVLADSLFDQGRFVEAADELERFAPVCEEACSVNQRIMLYGQMYATNLVLNRPVALKKAFVAVMSSGRAAAGK